MALKKQLNLFFDDLAYYPHCTDNFADGQYRAKKTKAIRKKYIEFNQPCLVSYFIFDLDYPESALAWQEENLPPPFWVAQNPKNGHEPEKWACAYLLSPTVPLPNNRNRKYQANAVRCKNSGCDWKKAES